MVGSKGNNANLARLGLGRAWTISFWIINSARIKKADFNQNMAFSYFLNSHLVFLTNFLSDSFFFSIFAFYSEVYF